MTARRVLFRTLGAIINALSRVSPARAGRMAFRLFATPPPPRVRPKEKAFLDTAARHDLTWRGLRLPVYVWGPEAGAVVFCAYGWGYNAGRWRHYVPALVAAGYRVVAYDPPGHGLAPKAQLDYPKMVDIQQAILRQFGGCELVLCHSFGGGCLVEALTGLPRELHPRRAVVMATFTEVYWIFKIFADSLGLWAPVFAAMRAYIERRTGRDLLEFDVARNARQLGHIATLLVHDPADGTTAFSAAERNHAHWPGSRLWATPGAGHHLGTAGVTRGVVAFLTAGTWPEGAREHPGELPPLERREPGERPAVTGGVSDYYS